MHVTFLKYETQIQHEPQCHVKVIQDLRLRVLLNSLFNSVKWPTHAFLPVPNYCQQNFTHKTLNYSLIVGHSGWKVNYAVFWTIYSAVKLNKERKRVPASVKPCKLRKITLLSFSEHSTQYLQGHHKASSALRDCGCQEFLWCWRAEQLLARCSDYKERAAWAELGPVTSLTTRRRTHVNRPQRSAEQSKQPQS